MDRAKIVERVARKVSMGLIAEWQVQSVLNAVGHFDLLAERDALRKVAEAARIKHSLCVSTAECEFCETEEENDECAACKRLHQALADLDALGGGK